MNILEIEGLSKSFAAVTVIDDISLSVPEGSVYGFLGENGAGKTTTMKMVLGLLRADRGEIRIGGEKVRFGQTKTNRQVGYLPDVPQFYSYMRADEYLRFCGEITGLKSAEIRTRSGEVLELVGLSKVRKKIGAYSRGMKQRLGVAQALINQPTLLICDEPTSALDPVGRKEILDILNHIRQQTTVIFSTHVLSDVERICDRAAVLHHGHIVLDGDLEDLKRKHGSNGLRVEFAHPDDTARLLALVPSDLVAEHTGTELTLRTVTEPENLAILQLLGEHSLLPLRFEALEPSMESLFLEVVS